MLEAATAAEEPQRPFTPADVANKALILEMLRYEDTVGNRS
jgi:hypothetical protein